MVNECHDEIGPPETPQESLSSAALVVSPSKWMWQVQREAGWAWRILRVAVAIVGVCAVGYLVLIIMLFQRLREPNDIVVFANHTAAPVLLVRVGDSGDELWSASIKSRGRHVEMIGGNNQCRDWAYEARNSVGVTIKTFTHECAGDVLEIP